MAIESIEGLDVVGVADLSPRVRHGVGMASQFEAMFLQSMFESACISQHFSDEESAVNIRYPQISHGVAGMPYESKLAVMTLEQSPNLKTLQAAVTPVSEPLSTSQNNDNSLNPSVDDFVKSLWPYVKQAAVITGIDPKILLAQAALETGWGHFIAKDSKGESSHNVFNIKSISQNTEESVDIKTTEYVANIPIKMIASFKKYPSIEQSVSDYVSLITSSVRYKTALSHTDSPNEYMNALQEAGYATDPNYAQKILSIYHGEELQQALERNGCV